MRCADAGNDVFTLGIDQEFTVEQIFPGTCVTGEGDAGAAVLAKIAEDHGLDVDRCAPRIRDIVQLAINFGAVVVPALEDRHHGTPELFPGIGRELAANPRTNQALETQDKLFQVLGLEIGIELDPLLLLDHVDNHFEGVVIFLRDRLEAHDNVTVHLDEAAVRVPGETLVVGLASQPGNRLVIEPEIEDGVHHARHRCARARADG